MTAPTAAYAQAHLHATATEAAAQQRITPKAGQLRGRVLQLVATAGETGLTALEVYQQYAWLFGEPTGGLYSLAPRLSELERRGGWVRKSGDVRDRRAAYVATDAGRAWVARNPLDVPDA
ncbi:hypothetical protein [Blastococcus mobilis]|uniref:PadR family transcriptional regulator n=1 Tax=Blastococcus mobilis TaxID=1938746 RepID=A0A238VE89_9ACTN|nr:hypothetical protein [Blastococcus mobilis]SNR32720.1 hypothetical protein SAMN06272737_10345 [Blastococcus mobilis]